MRFLVRAIAAFVIFLGAAFVATFWLAFFSERPPVMTDPQTLAGDGSKINYCQKPALDGSGKLAREIPKGNTPGCGYDHFPLPILAECTEPLPEGADDIRGLWLGVEGSMKGHVERIEQCGERVVVTTLGLIHDSGPNSTGGLTTNDTEGAVIFKIGDKEYCPRSSAGMVWNDGVLNFHAFGWGPVVVRRYMEGDVLIWEYANGGVTRLKRLCFLPEEHKFPQTNGPQFQLF